MADGTCESVIMTASCFDFKPTFISVEIEEVPIKKLVVEKFSADTKRGNVGKEFRGTIVFSCCECGDFKASHKARKTS